MLPSVSLLFYLFHPKSGKIVHARQNSQIPKIRSNAPPIVIGLAAKPLTITLYLSNAIAVIDQMEIENLKSGAIQNIIKKSEKARLTTNKLLGVLKFLVEVKMKTTMPFPITETVPRQPITKPRIACHSGFIGGN
ncbi:Protein of unknown function [Cotesia congregata]|uniref:Uncharacterized protein n=1 Tax=Cotesia congregata TaxID=51543 RepID=A0A8J2HG36_COTCN|nr:Protein of unknown function [Cotesia congregata]